MTNKVHLSPRMWNSFGLLDFIIAVSLGVLTRSGDILHLAGHPTRDIKSSFPVALIPGFALPFLVITHIINLCKSHAQG